MTGTSATRLSSLLRNAAWMQWDARTWLWLLTGFALLVRVAYVLVVGKDSLAWGDEISYDQLATNLLAHGCFCFVPGEPTLFRAPLYPMLMALFYSIFGHNFLPIVLAQALAGAFSAPLLALIGRKITGSLWIGLLAGLLFTLNPLLVFTSGLLYTETFYLFLLLLIVYSWLQLVDRPSNWLLLALGSGILFGLSVLMKPNLLLFPVWLALWAWLVFRQRGWGLLNVACITLAMLFVLLPWTLRNYEVTGKLVPVSTNTGLNLAQGNNSFVRGGALEASLLPATPDLSELERDAFYRQVGVDWIRQHPLEFIGLIPWKIYMFFSPLETSNRGAMMSVVAPLIYAGFSLFYLLALAGMIQTARQWRDWLLVHMLIVYPLLLTMIFYGGTRYGLVVHPFLALFAAVALAGLAGKLLNNLSLRRSRP